MLAGKLRSPKTPQINFVRACFAQENLGLAFETVLLLRSLKSCHKPWAFS